MGLSGFTRPVQLPVGVGIEGFTCRDEIVDNWAAPRCPPLLLVRQFHELALGEHAALEVDAAGVGIAGDTWITLFSSFCQVDELGLTVDVELAIDAFGVVSGGV